MSRIDGKIVLITGGASGIGKIMGRMVAEKGASLIIWDIDQGSLDATLLEFRSQFSDVYGYRVDISDPEAVHSMAERVRSEVGNPDILINNAGIVVGRYFHEHAVRDIDRTIDINTKAQMYLALEFLSSMIERNCGHICNVASSAGLISNPKMSVYCASKWASCGWSDSLRIEMEMMGKDVHVTTVTPYYISTGMFDGVRSVIPLLEPAAVAKKIIRGIERNKIFVSMPWSVRFVRFGQGVLPIRFFDWFIGRKLGIYKTMDHFKGRKKEA
ncbi:MAG: SDR family oxidoreductase [Bacteroidales bacterium]|nr:SDR family oxidoreductase [Bacteroidales bacterium]